MSWDARFICLAAVVCLSLVPGTPGISRSSGDPHRPDLRTLQPTGLRLVEDDGSTLLRFTNAIWNAGDGPLEVRPEHHPESGTTAAFQGVFTHDAAGTWTIVQEREAGSFEFHPTHDHWHFANLADYGLRSLEPDGTPTSEVVASSDKIGFCMFDEFSEEGDFEHRAPEPHYLGRRCDQNFTQGYSVGWGDTYKQDFPGQFVDVSDVEPGDYLLYSEADPSDLLIETDEENNAAGIVIRLTEDAVRAVTRTRATICRPCGRTRLPEGRAFTIRGSTRPTEAGQPIDLRFRRPGGRWRTFGESKKPFVFASPDAVFVSEDGTWRARFRPTRAGRWEIRARASRTQRSTASATELEIRVRGRGAARPAPTER